MNNSATLRGEKSGICQGVVIELAGVMLFLGGIFFKSTLRASRDISNFHWEGWQGLNGWSAVLIIAVFGYGVATS